MNPKRHVDDVNFLWREYWATQLAVLAPFVALFALSAFIAIMQLVAFR